MASLKSHFYAFVLKHTRKKAFMSEEGLRQRLVKMRPVEDHRPPEKVKDRLDITQSDVQDHVVYEARPKTGAVGRRILYLHGGAYCFELTPFHWLLIAELAERLSAQVTVPVYPLAPEHQFDQIYGMAGEVYRRVFAEAPHAAIVGDSAGGNMALVLTLMAAERGDPIASSLALLSPSVDSSLANPQVHDYAKRDPWLDIPGALAAMHMYAGGLNLADWRISPIYGDVAALPRTLIFSGTRDLLYPDTVLFVDKARAAGVDIDLVRGAGMFHVWPLLDIPEARPARDRMVAFLEQAPSQAAARAA